MCLKYKIWFLSFLVVALHGYELPSTVTRCDRESKDFSSCAAEATKQVKDFLVNGLPEKDIESIDPMPIDHFEIKDKDGSTNRLFNLNQRYRNVAVTGFGEFSIIDLKADFNKKCQLRAKAFMPRMNIYGDYQVTGQLMVFNLKGKGKANLTFTEVNLRAVLSCEFIDKPEFENEKFMKVNTFNFDLNPEKVYLDFENLFDGNALLSGTLSKFINDNSLVIFSELKEGYQNMFNQRFLSIVNKLLNDIPASKLFAS